jgi:DNA-binding response OmpR family regulator
VRTLKAAVETHRARRRLLSERTATPPPRVPIDTSAKPQSAPSPERPLKFLVVGPVFAEREWLTRRLCKPADEASGVSYGDEALAVLGQRAVDLVVLDASLVKPDVFEVLERIHTLAPETVCVVTVDRPSLRSITRFISLDVRAVLDKPLGERQFAERLDGILSRLRWSW